MEMNVCIAYILLMIKGFASAQLTDPLAQPIQTPINLSPFSRLFADLGDLAMHIDDALYRVNIPMAQVEEQKLGEFSNSDAGRSYFDQVRTNYATLQKRILQSIHNTGDFLTNSGIMNIDFQNRNNKAVVDISVPLVNAQFKAKSMPLKNRQGETKENDGETPRSSEQVPRLELPFSDVSGSIRIGGGGNKLKDSKTVKEESETEAMSENEPNEIQKRLGRYESQSSRRKQAHQNIRPSKPIPHRVDDVTMETSTSGIQGRILGDLLFEESTFDAYFRRMLKNHGKWLLDTPNFPPKRIVESIREITREPFKDDSILSGRKREHSLPLKNLQNEQLNKGDLLYPSEIPIIEPGSKVILAFTPEGVPLRLRIDSSVSNPLMFLHNTLSSARVSLNIPIESRQNIKPVGSDILQLGHGYDEMQPRVMFVDLSNRNQINSLLRSLRKYRD